MRAWGEQVREAGWDLTHLLQETAWVATDTGLTLRLLPSTQLWLEGDCIHQASR